MDLATKVNIALCILSFILAAISVVTVVITLRQNNKMISESTRPPVDRPESYVDKNMKRQVNTLREIAERLI